MQTTEQDSVREKVRARYGAIAGEADAAIEPGGCCQPAGSTAKASATAEATAKAGASAQGCGCGCSTDYAEELGYTSEQIAAAPEGANLNLGCGNPIAIASIKPGETVLDLGSGAGFDCFIAARQLAGTGRVIGVDMTPAMVSKARRNAMRSGYANVEFRLGEIEALPVADASVDLIISNCVINLSPDKPRVFREAFRVLKPDGRLSISDVIARRPLPAEWREDLDKLTNCVAGAEQKGDLERWLAEAGFADIRITPRDGSRKVIDEWEEGKNLGNYVVSAMIEARKP
ncbi:MAG: arsenite S-adenosylmethyltransferase [Verrucomicrobia bacterium RIFCSPLOWO2_12_FULL_64_8]|nr:MAG: arsenite S-adenosylmethyltransferase [Verrucomicrobia bacterium RIFCSPLOWO2_12_FULL_64_8]